MMCFGPVEVSSICHFQLPTYLRRRHGPQVIGRRTLYLASRSVHGPSSESLLGRRGPPSGQFYHLWVKAGPWPVGWGSYIAGQNLIQYNLAI